MTSRWQELDKAGKNAAVKERVVAGKTYQEIADEFSAPSPGSIAGVVTRLRDSGEMTKPTKGDSIQRQWEVAKRKQIAKRQMRGDGLTAKNISVAAEGRKRAAQKINPANISGKKASRDHDRDLAFPRTEAFEPLPGIAPVQLVDLSAVSCRWPVSGIVEIANLFCGELRKQGDSYCEYHSRLAYVPRNDRSKQVAV